MSIVILDESVASKIAAGEVIERPASVVKELIENALDAGARHIEVEVSGAGRDLIRVSDDGCGMSREDAVVSLQRHATSKIRRAEDLEAITTFGFRGEALASIASVSQFTMVTRAEGSEAATRLVASGGEVTELEEVGAPVGTQISVGKLFYNTPARLKFLKSDRAEAGHVTDIMHRFLFSSPETGVRLTQEGRETLQYGGASDLLAAIGTAWGRPLAEAMLPLQLDLPAISVRGFISSADAHRATRSRQLIFVNRRWVRNRTISHALDEACRGILPERRYAAAVLLVAVDPTAVDVNVHPTKSEVRLSREREVHHAVSRAIREAYSRAGAATTVELQRAGGAHSPSGLPSAGAFAQRELPEGWAGALAAPSVLSSSFQAQAARGQLDLRPLAQLRQTYILAESSGGLLLVDQHRAQERISYERFTQARLSQNADRQSLLTPVVVQLGPGEAAAVGAHLTDLSAFGFDLEAFGSDAFLVRGVPADLAGADASGVVKDLAEELSAESGVTSVEKLRERVAVMLSCRSAVKAGDSLSFDEMTELLSALVATARPYTCPHGWPIVMTISNFEIDRKFNR